MWGRLLKFQLHTNVYFSFACIIVRQFNTTESDKTRRKVFIFNIWLNKIHLCKQTQDKAITKPNKQENNYGLLHSQAMGLS